MRKGITSHTAEAMCLGVAIIWGSSFIVTETAIAAHMSASLLLTIRFLLASVTMFLACLPRLKKIRKQDLKVGITAGIFVFGGFYAQVLGQQGTTVSHCAFFTATYVVIIPFFTWALSRKRPTLQTFLITPLALVGIGILSLRPDNLTFSFNWGDGFSLLCAVLFAMHVSYLNVKMQDSDVRIINLLQLTTAGVISALVLLIAEPEAIAAADMKMGLPAVCYLGLICTCLGYFINTLAQKYTSSSRAGLILSTEGLFGSIFSVVLGMEPLTSNLIVGGLIIFSSMILMELKPGLWPSFKTSHRHKRIS